MRRFPTGSAAPPKHEQLISAYDFSVSGPGSHHPLIDMSGSICGRAGIRKVVAESLDREGVSRPRLLKVTRRDIGQRSHKLLLALALARSTPHGLAGLLTWCDRWQAALPRRALPNLRVMPSGPCGEVLKMYSECTQHSHKRSPLPNGR